MFNNKLKDENHMLLAKVVGLEAKICRIEKELEQANKPKPSIKNLAKLEVKKLNKENREATARLKKALTILGVYDVKTLEYIKKNGVVEITLPKVTVEIGWFRKAKVFYLNDIKRYSGSFSGVMYEKAIVDYILETEANHE